MKKGKKKEPKRQKLHEKNNRYNMTIFMNYKIMSIYTF